MPLDLAIGTHLPMSVGGEITTELPGRLLVQMHAGWLPRAYVLLINGVATRRSWYDGDTATVIEQTIDDAFVLRPSIGWRPFSKAGFELWLGYTHVRMGGATTESSLERAGVMEDMPPGDAPVDVSGKLHGVHAAVGWRFLIEGRVVIRAGLGYTNVIGADADVDSRSEAANRTAARRLEDAFTGYFQVLEPRVTIGLRL